MKEGKEKGKRGEVGEGKDKKKKWESKCVFVCEMVRS